MKTNNHLEASNIKYIFTKMYIQNDSNHKQLLHEDPATNKQ